MVAAPIRRALTMLIANGDSEEFAIAVIAGKKTIAVNNNPKRVIGGTIKSRVSASRSLFHPLAAENNNAGDFVSINPMWPCSQRWRCVFAPCAEFGKVLVTTAEGQNIGGWPAVASSTPSFRSSTINPPESSADRLICQE